MSEPSKRNELHESLRLHEEAARILKERLRPIQFDPTLRTMLEMNQRSWAKIMQPSADLIRDTRKLMSELNNADIAKSLKAISDAFKVFEGKANMKAFAESMRPLALKPEVFAGIERATRSLNAGTYAEVLRGISVMVDDFAANGLLDKIRSFVSDEEILDRVNNIPYEEVMEAAGNQEGSLNIDNIESINRTNFLYEVNDCLSGRVSFKDLNKPAQYIIIFIRSLHVTALLLTIYNQTHTLLSNVHSCAKEPRSSHSVPHTVALKVTLKVTTDGLHLRKKAHARASSITELAKWTELELLENGETTWVRVRVNTADGPLEGWVNSKHTMPADGSRIDPKRS